MSLKVLQALHTLLGAQVQKKPRNRGSIQDGEVGRSVPQGSSLRPNFPQQQSPQQLNRPIQGEMYNPGEASVQGRYKSRPRFNYLQGGQPWYDR